MKSVLETSSDLKEKEVEKIDLKGESIEKKEVGKYKCKTCKFEHNGNLDGPGYGHWPFSRQSKAEIMYNNLLLQKKLPIFIPLEPTEKPGALATCQLNGLKIAVYKGAYVDVPEQVAETFRTSLNQTSRIPFDAKTSPNPFTGAVNPANLSLRSDVDKGILDV